MDVLYPFLLTWLLVTGEAQDCPNPVGGANMNLKDSDILLQSFPEGTTVTFVCSVGYRSEGGSGASKCSAGVWSSPTLRCMRKNCGSAGEVANGNIDYKAGTEFGDTITIRCDQGYRLVGKDQMTCGDKGWLGRLPQCEVMVCDPPLPIKGGTLYPDKVSYDYRDVIQYSCDQGLTLNGTNSISCSVDGKFKPDPPTCISVECPEPQIKNVEWVEGSRPPHKHRAVVTYRCLTGFVMKGERTLICQIGNKWSAAYPVCEMVTCHPPTMMEKGFFRPNTVSYGYGDVVEYSCETGFELIGAKLLSCSDDGTFKPSPPTCKLVTCHPPTMMEKGFFRPNKVSYGYGDVVEYSCETGFELIGAKLLSCSDDGTFKPSPPTCKLSTIPTKTVTTPTIITTTPTSAAPSGPDLSTIAKGVGGFLAALVLFLVLFFGCRKLFEKMYRSGKDHTNKEDPNPDEEVALADRKGAGVESS